MKRHITAVTMLLGLGMIIMFGVPAQGYSLSSYKWKVIPVLFYLNPANGDVSTAAAEAAVKTALAAWNGKAPFSYAYAGRVTITKTGVDGKNVIMFRNTTNGSAIASTYSWTLNGARIDSDIIFWDYGRKFFTGTSGCLNGSYIEDIATHELGHSLGLSHSSVTAATMYPSVKSCTQTLRTLYSDDIAGLNKLY